MKAGEEKYLRDWLRASRSWKDDFLPPAPEEEPRKPEEGELTLIDAEAFYDLLMEQQEQM